MINAINQHPGRIAVLLHHTPHYDDIYSECFFDEDPETRFGLDRSYDSFCKAYY